MSSIGPVEPSKLRGSVHKKKDLSAMNKKELIQIIGKQLAFLKHRAYVSGSTAEYFIDDKKLVLLSHEELEKKAASLQRYLISETIQREYKPAISRYRVAQKMVDAEVSLIYDEISKKNKEIQNKWEEIQKQENAWLEENCKKLFGRDSKSLLEEYKIKSNSAYTFLTKAALSSGKYEELKGEFGKLREEHKKFKQQYRALQKELDDFIKVRDKKLESCSLREGKARREVELAIKKVLELEDYSKEVSSLKINDDKDVILSFPSSEIKELHNNGIDGNGISVAVVGTGVYPHPDFEDRIVAFKDFVEFNDEPSDGGGHETHVAGIIAGSGKISGKRYTGVAPGANIIGIRTGKDTRPSVDDENFHRTVTWIIENKDKYNIKIVNFSFGGNFSDKYWDLFIGKLIENGITVVAAAGNSGPRGGTINYPASNKAVISVGNLDQFSTTTVLDDIVATGSSRGSILDGKVKPDIIAPGVSIISTLARGSGADNEGRDIGIDFDKDGKNDYVIMSGTSMSAPFVSGVVALMYQVNPDLTPEEVGNILRETADKLPGVSKEAQGSGVINPQKAVEKARSLKK